MKKIVFSFISASFLLAEPSAFEAGNLDSPNPYGLTKDEKYILENKRNIQKLQKIINKQQLIINENKKTINDLKLKFVKLKLKNIPILGKALSYLFFGKDGYLHINIFVNGDLNNPKVSKDLGGGVIETPITLFKRILTLPFNLF